jgi:hypothetical protein
MKPISRNQIILGAAIGATLALPFLLRPGAKAPAPPGIETAATARKLIIISPHWEGIRHEFDLHRVGQAKTREGE